MTTALVWRTPERIPPFLDDAEAAGVLDRAQTRAKICLWPFRAWGTVPSKVSRNAHSPRRLPWRSSWKFPIFPSHEGELHRLILNALQAVRDGDVVAIQGLDYGPLWAAIALVSALREVRHATVFILDSSGYQGVGATPFEIAGSIFESTPLDHRVRIY